MKTYTTNYFDTLIEVAEDTKAFAGMKPPAKDSGPTIAQLQYEMIGESPYKFNSDDVLFQVFAIRNDLTKSQYKAARAVFFSKGQACMRTSPLAKTYGFGIHSDSEGKLALYGVETKKYNDLLSDPDVKKVKAMRSSKKK